MFSMPAKNILLAVLTFCLCPRRGQWQNDLGLQRDTIPLAGDGVSPLTFAPNAASRKGRRGTASPIYTNLIEVR